MPEADRYRLSWAITLAFTIAVLTGLLIVTRDLGITSDTFADGVMQARTLDTTTDGALDGAHQLPAATEAARQGLPEVVGIIDSLTRADQTLATLGDQLAILGVTLTSADAPLVGTIAAARDAGGQAGAAADPLGAITVTLNEANANAQTLGQKLDETLVLSQMIDQKLRIALLLPKIGN
ncbi:hypothetical protein [Nocardia rhizosphaerihabitans]|uniref:Uncharacterized protein n=1 Tax=Nocardia rhizosphaerihabitans TaxID=1691570 RepID=A0ABQ2L2W5_9NOCA|nr:hypothetical protein [Nocardia rhizosphaerihabitans]GGO00734.1 hypothetical protein GCM10011610_70010 [Nocardia rhizosphaerihabitans]